MHNTPASRTSKHGSGRRSNKRNKNSASQVKPPIMDGLSDVQDSTHLPSETEVEDLQGYDVAHLHHEFILGAQAPAPVTELADSVEAPFLEEIRPTLSPLPAQAIIPDELIHDPSAPLSDKNLLALDIGHEYEETFASSPPLARSQSNVADDEAQDAQPVIEDAGHTRAPVLVRRQSTSSTISKRLQNAQSFLPSTPQLPSFGLSNLTFSAPRISNVTATGSSFIRPQARSTPIPPKDTRRHSTGYHVERKKDLERLKMTPNPTGYDNSEDEDVNLSPLATTHIRYPSTSTQRERIIFSSFFHVASRHCLMIGYETGAQLWDTTNLDRVHEVLNLRMTGTVVNGGPLPTPPAISGKTDLFIEKRPLLGMVVERDKGSYLLVYSLSQQRPIKKLTFSSTNVLSFQASPAFLVVCTSDPASLHILCARTFSTLQVIPSRNLCLFSRPLPQAPHSHQHPSGVVEYAARQDEPHPVYSLSNRLLAYASRKSTPSGKSPTIAIAPSTLSRPNSFQIGSFNVTQADIGSAALKVGGGLLSGMKALGGMAVAAARGDTQDMGSSDRNGGFRQMFFSKSAPAASGRHERRAPGERLSMEDDDAGVLLQSQTGVSNSSARITILDLNPLLEEGGTSEVISEFVALKGQPVAGLSFSEDGTSLAVIPRDGTTVRTFQIRPQSSVVRRVNRDARLKEHEQSELGASTSSSSVISKDKSQGWILDRADSSPGSVLGDDEERPPWHIYNLRRGRTHGVIESVDVAGDGRWVACGTRNRTIHVFATNPYGGKTDEASHLDGRVRNVDTLQPLSTELRAIVRLRFNAAASLHNQPIVPLSFTLLSPSFAGMPPSLRYTGSLTMPYVSAPASAQSSPRHLSKPLPTRPSGKPRNYQDILVFDPTDGKLSLRRIILSTRSTDSVSSVLANLPIPTGTSISLPGMGLVARANSQSSSSSPPLGVTQPKASGVTKAMEPPPTEVVAIESSPMAAWPLLRGIEWEEVKKKIVELAKTGRTKYPKSEWTSQAELSTSSRSPNVLPGTIYLSHQFTFFALREDYHALIRRLHFDIPTMKIEVRREVEASPYALGHGESFVQPEEIDHQGRSFDESLASAMSGGLYYTSTTPPVIPMYPNGVPKMRTGSFKTPIPIRSVAAGLSEGVQEGFGRLRREISKVRSPQLLPKSEGHTPGSVPLEFNEEDEVFLDDDDIRVDVDRTSPERDRDRDSTTTSGGTSRGGADSGASVSTPSTTNNNLPLVGSDLLGLADGDLDGWAQEDVDAIEEAERYDEISAAGIMDEEQMGVKVRLPNSSGGGGTKRPPGGGMGRNLK